MQINMQRHHATQVPPVSQVAIILANGLPWSSRFEPTMARVGGLPVLLRAILGVQATHPGRIIVVFNRVTGPQLRHDLLKTRRLPDSVEWVEVAVGTTMSSILRWVT